MKNIATKYSYPYNFIYDICDEKDYKKLIEKGFCEYNEEVLKGADYLIDNNKHSEILTKYYKKQITFKDMQSEYNCCAQSLSTRVTRVKKYLLKEDNLIYIKLGYTKAKEYFEQIENAKRKLRQEREKSMLFNLSIDFLDIDICSNIYLKEAQIDTIKKLITTPKSKIQELKCIGDKRLDDIYTAIEQFMGLKINVLISFELYSEYEAVCIGGTNYGYEEWYYTKNYMEFYRDKELKKKLSKKGIEVWKDSVQVNSKREEVYKITRLLLNKKEIQYKCLRYIYNDDGEVLSMMLGEGKTPSEALNKCIENINRVEML